MTMQCGLCLSKKPFEFLDLGRQPMANKYPKRGAFKSEEFFRVKVFFCPNCKNIQLGTLVARDTMFKDYYYLSSVNRGLVRHYAAFARKKLNNAHFVVDVGSNDGISLKPLKEMGIKSLGVEPSINVSKVANDAGYETLTAFFDTKSAAKIQKEYGRPDVITGLSMFSHLQDPHKFIEDVKSLLTDDGRFIVEVEYNFTILKKMTFERFYLDRIFYFSVTSFEKLFRQHGMYLSDVEITDVHGGSLRVTAQKKGFGTNPTARVKRLIAQEERNLTPQKMRKFSKDAQAQIIALKKKIESYKKKGLKVAGYGSPARVATLTNFGGIGPELIDFIVDDSPLKQNRFTPGMHMPIVPNEHLKKDRPDVLVVFAYEYLDDIRKKLSGKYRYLLPIPPREVR